MRCERPRRGGNADKCDEFPSPHGFARAEDYIGYEQNITLFVENCAVRYTQTGRCHVRFSNRPFEVKRFQTIDHDSVDVTPRARASLRNRHQGPSIMGFEDEVELSFGRPYRQIDGRSKRTCALTSSVVPPRDIIPPLGGVRVSSYV
jgi:hypothetical protein